MRYRPFSSSGTAVSALSLALPDDPARPTAQDWVTYVYAALENGINAFEVTGRSAALADGLAQALQTVERNLVFVAWRIGRLPPSSRPVQDFSAAAISGQVRAILARTGLQYLDVAMLDDPGANELPVEGLAALGQLKQGGAIRFIGVGGDDDAIDAYLNTGRFDVLGTRFNLTSGWRDRNRLRASVQRDMAVIGYEPFPPELCASPEQERKGLFFRRRPVDTGPYAFLQHVPNWSCEEICVGFALTEPAIATVQLVAPQLDQLEALAAIADRELPHGLPAQIEMARFTALGGEAKRA